MARPRPQVATTIAVLILFLVAEVVSSGEAITISYMLSSWCSSPSDGQQPCLNRPPDLNQLKPLTHTSSPFTLVSATSLCKITTTTTGSHNSSNSVRITRIKLLRPTDTLILGQVYRLITTEEVMKGLWAKKYAKMKKRQSESPDKQERMKEKMGSDSEMKNTNQVQKHERHRPRTTTTGNSAAAKSRAWPGPGW
ncbi:hypothetical protein HYC85_022071 [Camellia sinensis]|uniref:Uncharacterized protein n=1 Tax=Camellia sinensis TaxID=4442 RepID=A0A7J7GN91_CAMSI|nr:hypothetical protein HYC85_022071 [Camellia sinensis]